MKTNRDVNPAWDMTYPLHMTHLSGNSRHPHVTPLPVIGGIVNVTNSPVRYANRPLAPSHQMGGVMPMSNHVAHVSRAHTTSGGFFFIPLLIPPGGAVLTTEDGMTTITAPSMRGTLDCFATNVTISAGSVINHLNLDCYRTHYLPPRFTRPFTGPVSRQNRDNVMMAHHNYGQPTYWRQSNNTREPPLRITQCVRLEKGATLNHLTFSGHRCELTLEEGAKYNGFRWTNLHIIKSGSSSRWHHPEV